MIPDFDGGCRGELTCPVGQIVMTGTSQGVARKHSCDVRYLSFRRQFSRSVFARRVFAGRRTVAIDILLKREAPNVADLNRQEAEASAQESNAEPALPNGWDDGCDEVVLLMMAAFKGTGFLVSQFMTIEVMMKLGVRLGKPAERVRKSDLACEQIKSLLTGPVNKIDEKLSAFGRTAAQRIFMSRSRSAPSSIASLLSDMEDLARNNTGSLSKIVIENCRQTWTGQQPHS